MSYNSKRKIRVTYVIREAEAESAHRGGVNAVITTADQSRVLTAGRDSISEIRQMVHARSFEGHADWVNALALVEEYGVLVTGSSDSTVKLWQCSSSILSRHADPLSFSPSITRIEHSDYVKAIGYSAGPRRVASAALDGVVVLWDLEPFAKIGSWSESVDVPTSKMFGFVVFNADVHSFRTKTASYYSLATNHSGNIILTGSADKTIRIWDARSSSSAGVLKGHTDTVKALAISNDSTTCVSGASDGTIKSWDIRSHRCIHTFTPHSDSIWSLQMTSDFKYAITGGRDQAVYMTDISGNPDDDPSLLLALENAPILSVWSNLDWYSSNRLLEMQMHLSSSNSLWVSTSSSSVNNWNISGAREILESGKTKTDDDADVSAFVQTPTKLIKGKEALREFSILNNRVQVLTRDSNQQVALWDIVQARKLTEFGQINLEDKVKELNMNQGILPQWCLLDVKMGVLSVHLDDSDCFAAWTYAGSIPGVAESMAEDKINIGGSVVQALLKPLQYYYFKQDYLRQNSRPPEEELKAIIQDDLDRHGLTHSYFTMPPHLPVYLTLMGEPRSCIGHFFQKDMLPLENLTSHFPQGIINALTNRSAPFGEKYRAPQKITFDVTPQPDTPRALALEKLHKPKLTCPTILKLAKIADFIANELKLRNKDDSSAPRGIDIVELLFNGEVLDPQLDLAAMKFQYWRRVDENKLYYRRKQTEGLQQLPI